MKKVTVKTHKRKGKTVRSHSRTTKSESVKMDYKACKEKYDKLVKKHGPDHPMVQKLADKLEDMDTVTKHAQTTERFMRKKLKDEDIVKKEAKTKVKKNARTTLNKKTGKYESGSGSGSRWSATANEDLQAHEYREGKNINAHINSKATDLGLKPNKKGKNQYSSRVMPFKEFKGMNKTDKDFGRSDNIGKQHSSTGKGNKAARRTAEAKKQKAMAGKVKNPKTGRMVSKEYLEKNR